MIAFVDTQTPVAGFLDWIPWFPTNLDETGGAADDAQASPAQSTVKQRPVQQEMPDTEATKKDTTTEPPTRRLPRRDFHTKHGGGGVRRRTKRRRFTLGELIITPPVDRTPWVKILLGAAGLGLVVGMISPRLHR